MYLLAELLTPLLILFELSKHVGCNKSREFIFRIQCTLKCEQVGNARAECQKACEDPSGNRIPLLLIPTRGFQLGQEIIRNLSETYSNARCPNIFQSASHSTSGEDTSNLLSCVDTCETDEDCNESFEKCCQIGCRKFCMNYIDPGETTTPDLIQSAKITESDSFKREILLTIGGNHVGIDRNLFIVQMRYCSCEFFMPEQASHWEILLLTESRKVSLGEFPLGRIYQFRVGVINEHGLRGYYHSDDLIYPRHRRNTLVLGRPTNFREVQRIHRADERHLVRIKLAWDTTDSISNLTNIEYQIILKNLSISESQSRVQLTNIYFVPGEVKNLFLDRISINKNYSCEITVMNFKQGNGYMRSEPEHLYLNTEMAKTNIEDPKSQDFCQCNETFTICNHVTSHQDIHTYEDAQGTGIIVKDKVNQVRVTPSVCIEPSHPSKKISTRDNYEATVSINYNQVYFQDLTANCLYRVNIESVQKKRQVTENLLNVCSGSRCSPSLTEDDDCIPKVLRDYSLEPMMPSKLQIKMLSLSSYQISWMDPEEETQTSFTDNIKFRITWGKGIIEHVDESLYAYKNFEPILEGNEKFVKIVDYNTRNFLLNDLEASRIYLVHISKILIYNTNPIDSVQSPEAYIYFKT